jgi:hypothetical protein
MATAHVAGTIIIFGCATKYAALFRIVCVSLCTIDRTQACLQSHTGRAPASLVANLLGSPSPVHLQTTIIAVQYDGGVVLGADSRTSTGMCAALRRHTLI